MTTFIDFAPSATSNFQFQAEFDGGIYTVIVTWNLFGARYYVNIYDLSGTLIVSRPMIGSPNGYPLSSVVRENSVAVATTSTPHSYPIGALLNLTVSNVSPADYNGTFPCRIVSATQISYAITTAPSNATSFGNVAYNISLTAGYFTTQLVWRVENNQFEII